MSSLIEYRTERVDPNNESSVVNILGNFGWQLVDSQEIYNEHTEVTGVDATVYGNGIVGSFMRGYTGKDGTVNVRQRTTVTNYVVLRFARDTEMENYGRLAELGNEFESKLGISEPKKPIARTAILSIGVFILIVSIILAIIQKTAVEFYDIIIIAVFAVIMIPLTVLGWVKYKKRIADYNLVQQRLLAILEEADELL